MSQSLPESTDLQSDSNSESLDSGVGLADRTQQLLDEVDQLLGPGSSSVRETPVAEESKPSGKLADSDLGESVETLKNFLKEINGEESGESNESSEVDATQNSEDDFEGDECETSVIPEDFDSTSELENNAEAICDEPESENDLEVDSDAETAEPIEVAVASEESAETDCGFDIDALRRAFDDDEDSEAEAESDNSTGDSPEPPAVSPESWLAENLAADPEDLTNDQRESEQTVSEAISFRHDEPSEVSVAQPQMPGAIDVDNRISMMESSMDSMFQHLEHRILDMFQNLADQINAVSSPPVDQVQFVESVPTSEQEPENESSEEEPKSDAVEESPAVEKVDSDKVSELKEQLTSKLREAEIELSINRAKLSQQRAKIEQMQADLDRREAVLDDKLEQAKKMGLDKKKGLLDRWKRHMGDEE